MKLFEDGRGRSWAFWGLCAWGLLVRVFAAGKAFPASGDASHFVLHGKAFTALGFEAISGYWSILPQYLSAWAVELGASAQWTLQTTTVLFGVALVGAVYALALELTGKRAVALSAGLLIATNPVLTASSVSGLSETPHMALATWALVLAFRGARKRKAAWFVAAALAGGVDLYYRPYDLALYLFGAFPFVLWRLRGAGRWRGAVLVVCGLLVGGMASVPFFVITAKKSAGSAGSSKLVNLAFRKDGLSAQAMYAAKGIRAEESSLNREIRELQDAGVARYIWAHRGEMARDFFPNFVKGVRHLDEHAFAGMFRMGMFWFALLGMLCAWAMFRQGLGGVALYAMVATGVVFSALSIGFVHPRWIMQCLPFYALLAGGGFAWLAERAPAGLCRNLLWTCLLSGALLNGRWAVARLDDEWKDRNLFAAASRLRERVAENEKLMCFRPELAALFYQTNTLAWLTIPYGEVGEVFEWAELQHVDCLVLNDSVFPHFPIHGIERHPDTLPPGWREIDRFEFAKDTRFGPETNVFRVYRRAGASRENRDFRHRLQRGVPCRGDAAADSLGCVG